MSTKTAVAIVIGATVVTLGAAATIGAASGQQSTQDKPFSLLSPSLYGVDNFHAYCSPWGPTFRALDSSDRSVALRIANVVEYLASIQQ